MNETAAIAAKKIDNNSRGNGGQNNNQGGNGNTDADGDGVTIGEGDCNDTDPDVYPGAYDTPDDGIDQDCSGSDAT
jgi:hypothetical protein